MEAVTPNRKAVPLRKPRRMPGIGSTVLGSTVSASSTASILRPVKDRHLRRWRAVALVRVLEVCAVVAGLVAVSALIYASVVLIRETRIVVQVLQEQAAIVRARAVPQGGHAA